MESPDQTEKIDRLAAVRSPAALKRFHLKDAVEDAASCCPLSARYPSNTGAILRLCACFGTPLEIVEPCGFVWTDAKLRRAGLDYAEMAQVTRHPNWEAFRANRPERMILATTKDAGSVYGFEYRGDDILLLGSETAGVPDAVHAQADARLRIPIRPGARSLNLATAAGMVLAEALRVTGGFSEPLESL